VGISHSTSIHEFKDFLSRKTDKIDKNQGPIRVDEALGYYLFEGLSVIKP